MESAVMPSGVRWHAIRPLLGIRAIGISAASGGPGDLLVEPHDEAQDGRGHEEIYVVLSGAARFTLAGDDEIDARPGTLVLVRPGTNRVAVATETGTLLLAVGGPPDFEPAGSEWLELARPHIESNPGRAADLLDRGIDEIPDSAAIPFGVALLAATHGHDEQALAALELAIEREPRLRADAEREEALAPLVSRLD
jgi:hypothetical protein